MKIKPLTKGMLDMSGSDQVLPTGDNLDLMFGKINEIIEHLNPKKIAVVVTPENRLYKKIPIIITKFEDQDKGWRAEIADGWETYKPTRHDDINFEDIGFHFEGVEVYDDQYDRYVFPRKKDAVEAAQVVVKRLQGKAKIWHIS